MFGAVNIRNTWFLKFSKNNENTELMKNKKDKPSKTVVK